MKLKWHKTREGGRMAFLKGGCVNSRNRIILKRDGFGEVIIALIVYYRGEALRLHDHIPDESKSWKRAERRAQAIADAFEGAKHE